jgi:hypothetical protein
VTWFEEITGREYALKCGSREELAAMTMANKA